VSLPAISWKSPVALAITSNVCNSFSQSMPLVTLDFSQILALSEAS
jgi:hypothetical protein